MDRFIGLIGIALILGIAYLLSNNRKAINYRVVGMGLLIQATLHYYGLIFKEFKLINKIKAQLKRFNYNF